MLKDILLIHFFALGLLVLLLGIPTPAIAGGVAISLEYKNEPLSEVLNKFSSASGYDIIVNGQGADTPVSGKIENFPLEDAVRNILKRLNSTIVWDEKNRKIMISIYDSSQEKGTGIRVQPDGRVREPVRSSSYSSQPASGRNATSYYNDDRDNNVYPGATISGEGRRFVQGTWTTDP